MKTPAIALLATLIGTAASAADAPAPGYLLLTIEKDSYSNGATPTNNKNSDQVQKYKILLDPAFLSQFKNPPTPTSSGTQFYCGMSDSTGFASPGVSFTQWFAPSAGGKVATWFWGEGVEQIDGKMISAENAKAQVNLKFPSWQTIDSSEMLSFENDTDASIDGINLSIASTYVDAGDASLTGALLVPVNGTDGKPYVAGDAQTGVTLTARCSFQND